MIPDNLEIVKLSLSSLNFADLLIDLENRLELGFADECMLEVTITVSELVDKILGLTEDDNNEKK